ncbi:hypothetical protein ACTFIW_009726 [Dictyostelium discoideum]
MIKALAAVKKQIEEINEYEKRIGPDCNLSQFQVTLENFNKLRQAQNAVILAKQSKANSGKIVEPTEAQLVANFNEWLKGKGFDESKCKVKIDRNTSEGTGLVATQDIKEGEDFVEIPSNIFITTAVAFQGLGKPPILENDRLIQSIPGILLSIFLVKELSNPASEWGPYIKLLPKQYNTVYYWGLKEFTQFRGSPNLEYAMRYVRGAMRQYCYLYSMIDRTQSNIMPISSFTWDAFVWAISTVQSRQNPVYAGNGSGSIMALIPFWDFCNHSSTGSKITSFYHTETNCMTSGAIKDFKKGEQVYMFYGPRDNTQLLMHAGFATKTNLHDSYPFELHLLEGNHEIRHDKVHLLEERGIRDGVVVNLNQNPTSNELPLELIPFYRIYALSEQETRAIAPPQVPGEHNHHHGHQLELKPLAFKIITQENEEKAYSNLVQALKGKLASYPTTLEEDEQELKKNPPANQRFILYTKINEKKILDRNIKYLESLIKKGVMNVTFKLPELVEQQTEHADHDHEHGDNCNHEDHGSHGHSHGGDGDDSHGHSHGGNDNHNHSHGGHSHQHGANCNH